MREWYFQTMGQELGPFTAAELKTKVEGGLIQPDTMVRRGLEGKWLYADRVKGLLPARPEPEPPPPVPRGKPKSSATMPVVDDRGRDTKPASSAQIPVMSISLEGDDDQDAHAPSVEFYDFVGFREAISPALHQAVKQYLTEHRLTMTQLNRRALAGFIARPELAADLMITNMAVIPQQVNEKSNADGSKPLSDRERTEHATFRVTLFNCSPNALDVTGGEFVPDTVEVREYEEIGTKVLPAIDHKGHATIKLDGIKAGQGIPVPVKTTVPSLAASNVTVWFRGTNKPSLTRIRGTLRVDAEGEVALSEPFTVIMHADSP